MIICNGKNYFESDFDDETEIEKVVEQYSTVFFGDNIIFLPKSKIITSGGTGTIPDGIVINIDHKQWFIVEAELAKHGTWNHIILQLSKQFTAASSPKTIESLIELTLKMVKEDETLADKFNQAGIDKLHIHGFVQSILKNTPIFAVPIDKIPDDLGRWINTQKYVIRTWIIKRYQCFDDQSIAYFLPDDTTPTIATSTKNGIVTITSSNYSLANLIRKNLLVDGQPLVLEYGPKGQRKMIFKGVARPDGVEIEGKVMSPSTAAVYCIKKAGGTSETANGRDRWRIENGASLNDLFEKFALLQQDGTENSMQDGDAGQQ